MQPISPREEVQPLGKILDEIVEKMIDGATGQISQERSPQDSYNELAGYTLSLRDTSFIHQYVVDAFAAQHADSETKPIKVSFALIGLYLHIEKGFSGKEVQKAHMKLAKHRKQWPVFVLPECRGSITISYVLDALPGPERDKAIDKWCHSIWEAYGQSHKIVAKLVETELYRNK